MQKRKRSFSSSEQFPFYWTSDDASFIETYKEKEHNIGKLQHDVVGFAHLKYGQNGLHRVAGQSGKKGKQGELCELT